MAMELACGNCQGRLLVETPGVIVACPHCGIHLQTPGAPPAPPVELAAPPFVTTNAPVQPSPAPEFQNSEVTLQMPPNFGAPEPAPVHGATETLWQPPEMPAPDLTFPAPAWEAPMPNDVPVEANTAQWSDPQPDPPAPAWLAPEDVSPFSFPATQAGESPFPDFSTSAPPPDRTEALLAPTMLDQQAVAPSVPLEVAEVQPPAADTPPSFVLATPAGNAPTEFIAQTQDFVQETSPFGTAALPPTIQEFPATPAHAPTVDTFAQPFSPPSASVPVSAVSAAATTVRLDPDTVPGTFTESPAGFGGPSPLPQDETYSRQRGGLSPQTVKILLSYASAVTLACVYLVYLLMTVSTHQLESLPDLAPPVDRKNPNKEVSLRHVQVSAAMPPMHTLRLGQSERYGSLRVTPLKVTKEMLEFTHYDPTSKETKAAVGPVLKLWLQFENVSDDQEFSPFDRKLLYAREPLMKNKRMTDIMLSNNWLCWKDEKTQDGERWLVYDLPNGSWDCKGQDVEHVIKPGETFPTYIPTVPDDLESLKSSGTLLWRVHFRKGYNPTSFRGVTTLIEVEFESDEIEDDTQVAAPAANPTHTHAPDGASSKQNA